MKKEKGKKYAVRTKTGFRKNRSTIDNVYMLQYIVKGKRQHFEEDTKKKRQTRRRDKEDEETKKKRKIQKRRRDKETLSRNNQKLNFIVSFSKNN